MGMFDYLHYEGDIYQTKDTPRQSLDDFRIEDNQLWWENYDSEWIEGGAIFGGRFEKINRRWELCDNFDGVVRFNREDHARGGYRANAWIRYEALFMDGHMIKLTQTEGLEPFTVWYKNGIENLSLKEQK